MRLQILLSLLPKTCSRVLPSHQAVKFPRIFFGVESFQEHLCFNRELSIELRFPKQSLICLETSESYLGEFSCQAALRARC